MRRCLWLLLLIALQAQAGDPLIRLQTEPQGVLAPGQGLTLHVQLLVPSYFLAAPAFPELSLSDGSRAAPGESLNLNTRIAGESYAGIQRSYHFPPLATGQYRLKPQTLTLRYADEQNRPLEARLALPDWSVEVEPGAAGTTDLAAEPQLRVSERYFPNGDRLHTGDILRRDLRIELYDAGPLLPPSPQVPEAPGTRLYRSAPRLSHDEQRGARSSVREEELRYLLTEPGEVELPPLRLQWRDTRTGQLQQLDLPARHLRVEERTPRASAASRFTSLWLAVLGGGLLVAGLALRTPWLRRWRAARMRWKALRQAARGNDPLAVEHALETWLDGLPEPRRQAVRAALGQEIDTLMQARYAPSPGGWQAAALLRQASRLRGWRSPPVSDPQDKMRLNP